MVLSPLLLIIAVLLKFAGEGEISFRQKCIGKDQNRLLLKNSFLRPVFLEAEEPGRGVQNKSSGPAAA